MRSGRSRTAVDRHFGQRILLYPLSGTIVAMTSGDYQRAGMIADRTLDIRSATQDASLLDALSLVYRLRHPRRDGVISAIDLGFAAEHWQRFVAKTQVRICRPR